MTSSCSLKSLRCAGLRLLLAAVAVTIPISAQGRTLSLPEDGVPYSSLGDFLWVPLEGQGSEARLPDRGAPSQSVADLERTGPIVEDYGWIVVPIVNRSTRPATYRFDTRDTYWNSARVWLRNQGADTLVLDNRWHELDAPERFPEGRLRASTPIVMAPGERAELWIEVTHAWSLAEVFWLPTEAAFTAQRQGDMLKVGMSFGVRVALLFGILVLALILRSAPAGWYALFVASSTLLYLQVYGFTQQTLVTFDADSWWFFVMSCLGHTFFALTAWRFISSRGRHRNYERAMVVIVAFAWISGFIGVSSDFFDRFAIVGPAVFLLMLLALWGARIAFVSGSPGARLYVVAAVSYVLLHAFALVAFWPLMLFTKPTIMDVGQIGLILDAVIVAGALGAQAIGLRRERDVARTEAEVRRRVLATTSHDIRQPLLSLKLALRGRDESSAVTESIDYLESLLVHSLEGDRSETMSLAGESSGPDESDRLPTIDVDAVLKNAVLMFSEEAAAAGVQVGYVPTSAKARGSELALMRIVTNLLANAIKHTTGERITLGIRRRDETFSVWVVDQGPGLSSVEIEEALKPYHAGSESRGSGLGLDVVRELAHENAWWLNVASRINAGSVFALDGLKPV